MEEKLDMTLRWFYDKKITQSPWLKPKELPLEIEEENIVLTKLHKDGYIYSSMWETNITGIGKMFLQQGGYVEKKRREDYKDQIAVSQLQYAKKAYWIAIITLGVSIIAVFIGIVK